MRIVANMKKFPFFGGNMALFRYSEIEQNLIENSRIPFGVFQRIGSNVTAIAVTKGLCDLFGFDSL